VTRFYLAIGLYLAASFVFIKYLLPYFLPFLLGFFFALALDWMVTRMEKWRIPRSVGAAVSLLLVGGGLVLFLTLALSRLVAELSGLVSALPLSFAAWREMRDEFFLFLERSFRTLPPWVRGAMDQQLSGIYGALQGFLLSTLNVLQGWLLRGVPGFAILVILSALTTYLVSRDKRLIRDFILSLFPPLWRRGIMQVKSEVMGSTLGLIKTQFVLVSLTFFVTLLGLSLLGIPYALTISFLAGILDILPVVGPAIIFVPWVVVLFLTGQYMTGVWIAVLYGSVALLRALAHPYVLGGTLGLHPLAALLSLYLGARLFGPAGLIWGPLVLVVLKAAISSGLLPRPEA